jgi:2-amino-4-hydroxy-6-hydroxymethyldihydropteridine diphosphokinase
MNTAYILLGTNLGDKITNIKTACGLIDLEAGKVVKSSGLYETSPWGNTDQSYFINQVIALETIHEAEKLLEILLEIEKKMGRVRMLKWGERIIDLDILYFNNSILSSERLTIPHPELHRRRFTLVPLCEIAAGYVHPMLQLTNQVLLDGCEDRGAVTKTFVV